MGEEKEGKSPDLETAPDTAKPSEPAPEVPEKPAVQTAAEEGSEYVNNLKEKRGRMVVTGLLITVILSVVVLVVVGIFQLTSWWSRVCPTDPPVNVRAPELWNELVSEKVSSKPLGVPEKLVAETAMKPNPSPTPETPGPQDQEKK
jgi:hypothetical protein